MQSPEFADKVQWVADPARTERFVLMCAEALPWRCHRPLIGDALLVRGVRVWDDGRAAMLSIKVKAA